MSEEQVYPQAAIGYRLWAAEPVLSSLHALLRSDADLGLSAAKPEPLPRLYPINPIVQLAAELAVSGPEAVDDAGAWKPGVNIAHCMSDPSHLQPPVEGCGCGLYAWHDPNQLDDPTHIFGAVLARGKLQIHHHGFRAQEVQVIGLLRDTYYLNPFWLQRVADHYQVPLFDNIAALQEHAETLGATVPESLRPAEPSLYE